MIDRRQFITRAATAAAACALCPGRIALAEPRKSRRVDIGTPADYAAAGVTTTWARQHRFFVIRRGDRLFAASSICTHDDVRLEAKADRLYCAEHDSAFTLEGRVKYGRPRRGLPRYGIELTDDDRIIVDTSKRYPPNKWNDAGASIDLKSG